MSDEPREVSFEEFKPGEHEVRLDPKTAESLRQMLKEAHAIGHALYWCEENEVSIHFVTFQGQKFCTLHKDTGGGWKAGLQGHAQADTFLNAVKALKAKLGVP